MLQPRSRWSPCLVVVLCGACSVAGPGGESPSPRATGTSISAAVPPSVEQIRGLTVPTLPDLEGPLALVDGVWEGPPYVEGGAARPRVQLVDWPALVGDLDRDDTPEAVALLAKSGSGTGVVLHLAVVERAGTGARATAIASVGDRVQLRGGRLEDSAIVLDLVQAGAGDAMCCPGDLVTRRWRLQGDALVEGVPHKTGRLAPEVMAGPEWVLVAWARDEPAPADLELTLRYEEGRLTGFAGCNRYLAPIAAGASPGEISVGPVGGTKKLCMGAPMEVERRFTALLGAVDLFSFLNGRLALTATIDGAPSTMLFEARPAS